MKFNIFVSLFMLASVNLLFAAVTMVDGTDVVELKPTQVDEKLLCVLPEKTYCLNVVDYPREELNMLVKILLQPVSHRSPKFELPVQTEEDIN